MAQFIYLMSTTKTILQITILMQQKMLESFLMNIEVIFQLKKQRELEKNFVEQKLSIMF